MKKRGDLKKMKSTPTIKEKGSRRKSHMPANPRNKRIEKGPKNQKPARNDNWPLSWHGPGLGAMIYIEEPYGE
jgi:hypothetical protein